MAAKQAEAPLQSPMRLLDALFFLQEHEKAGTPRPSKARFLFISGMQDLGKGKLASARTKLAEALAEAEKEPAHKEEIAICKIGVGFLHAAAPGPERDLAKTRDLYVQALETLGEFLGSDCPQLAPLTADIAVVCAAQGNKDDASRFLERARNQLARKDTPHKEQTAEHHQRTMPQILAQVSQAHAQLGDLAHAVELMRLAVEFMQRVQDPSLRAAQLVLANLEKQLAAKA